ncbi:MAG: alkaline phosphatase [Deltaproteobacteria bacterium]|nr:alkaline phosphatase [Deltaproteobacteria bacterium]
MPTKRRLLITLIVVFMALVLWIPQGVLAAGPKNVIFYIGDGMAAAQRRIPEEVYGRKLAMNTLPVVGIYTTYSLSSIVTDSAGAGTAMATGHKTRSTCISMDRKGKIAYETLAEAAKKLGKSVGILTTTRLTHATPATFAAHIRTRYWENKIADQYLDQGFEVWMGGGRRYFIPKTAHNRQEPDRGMKSKRKDERDLLKEFEAKGYSVLRTKSELIALEIKKGTKIFAAFTYSHLPYYLDRPDEVPNLAEMTLVAIKVLKQNPKGFFLMVEGGRIDHACHANASAGTVGDVIDLDNAVKVGIDFSKEDPDTLILVGGDHETGGMAMGIGKDYFMRPEVIKKVTKSEMWLGYGKVLKTPDKAIEIFTKYTRITDLTEEETKEIEKVIEYTKAGQGQKSPNRTYNPSWFGFTFASILSKRARIGWTTFAHTGHPVMITAGGPGSEKFTGFYDNTDIPKKITSLWGVTLKSWPVKRTGRKK